MKLKIKVLNFLRNKSRALSFFFVLFFFVFAGVKNDLYEELWKLCAGPLVDVPNTGDRVFYFPQGHMEQVWFFSLTLFNVVAIFVFCVLYSIFV